MRAIKRKRMWESASCQASVEEIESRRYLAAAAAFEVWAGNTEFNPSPSYAQLKSAGFKKIGESNKANAANKFTATKSYDYYAIAFRARVSVDAVKLADGTYPDPDSAWLGAMLNDGIIANGEPNWSGVTVRMVENISNAKGLTVHTRGIRPAGYAFFDKTAEFIPTYKSILETEMNFDFQEPGYVQSARLRSPSGVWHVLEADRDGDGLVVWELKDEASEFETLSDLNKAFPDGSYTLELKSPAGVYKTVFVLGDPDTGKPFAWPELTPITVTPGHGNQKVSAKPTFTWPLVEDPNASHLKVVIDNVTYHNAPLYVYLPTTDQSVGPVTLNTGKNYLMEFTVLAQRSGNNADGFWYRCEKEVCTKSLFRTGGKTVKPDFVINEFTLEKTSHRAGDTVGAFVKAGNAGAGNAIGIDGKKNFVPIVHQVRLSRDHVWGNSDDIILFTSLDDGEMGGGDDHLERSYFTFKTPSTIPSGSYYVAVMSDATKVVAESNEKNNIRWDARKITISRR